MRNAFTIVCPPLPLIQRYVLGPLTSSRIRLNAPLLKINGNVVPDCVAGAPEAQVPSGPPGNTMVPSTSSG